MYESERALYLDASKSKVVEEGDPQAAYLLVAAGGRLHIEDAIRYGLVEAKGRSATHKTTGGFNGFIHDKIDPFIRRMEHSVPSVGSKAGTPEGGDGYPSKHPELGRADFDEAHDEDPQISDADAKAQEAAKQAAKDDAERQSATAEKVRAEEEKARADAEAAAAAESAKKK